MFIKPGLGGGKQGLRQATAKSTFRTVGSDLHAWSVIRAISSKGQALWRVIRPIGGKGLTLWRTIRAIVGNRVLVFSGLGEEVFFLIARYCECACAECEGDEGKQLTNIFHGHFSKKY